MAFPWLARHPLVLHQFRFLDPITGKWTRARYVATQAEIAARFARWQTVGPAEVRDVVVGSFSPDRAPAATGPEIGPRDPGLQLIAPAELDAGESALARLFLRRYVTWCARRRRYAAMQGAAALCNLLTRPALGPASEHITPP